MSEYTVLIRPGDADRNYWRDLWHFRELLYLLAYRDIAVRYKQTLIGITWALLRPALTMLVFVAFRRVTKLSHAVYPDTLLVFSAVLPWQLFSNSLTEASSSLVANANLISKVYFPRMLIPAGAVVAGLVDFVAMFGILVVIMCCHAYPPSLSMLLLPVLVFATVALSIGSGLFFAALNVKYRDFRYVVPFIVQFGLFLSPIALDTEDIPEKWRLLYSLNPLVGIIDGFRWAILGAEQFYRPLSFVLSLVVTAMSLYAGFRIFRSTEREFADII